MIISTRPFVGRSCRRGSVLPFLAFVIVALVAFLALAIDLGMLAIAKTQAQNAADLAALTAMRTVNGDPTSTYNSVAATTNAQNILTYNAILGKAIQSSQLTLTYGSYDYNSTTQLFSANYPPTSGVPYTAASATITFGNYGSMFSSVLGASVLPTVTATAQAVHRPRDIGLVMDLSGSMRYGTMLGFDITGNSRSTNNPDTTIPTFGASSSTSAVLTATSSNRTSAYDSYTISPSNTSTTNASYSLTYINGFYQSAAYASTVIRAFDSFSSADNGKTWTAPTTQTPQLPPSSYNNVPGGDAPLFQSGSTSVYAQNVNDVLGVTPNTTTTTSINATNAILWELDGYSAYSAGQPDTSTSSVPKVWTQVDYSASGCQFNGYTQGPGYYGKTFFLWPPDPRNKTALSGSSLITFLGLLGINAADQTTLSGIWSTWQGLGVGPGSTGLSKLQKWLKGTAVGGAGSLPTFSGNYTPTSTTALVPGVTSWNGTTLSSSNQPKTYYAVCRLFNRAYPAGSSWTGASRSSGTSYSADWRLQFFGVSDNTKLFNSTSGKLNLPGASTYTINYNAILSWLTTSPNPFPTEMRAGRVLYYSAIPTSITGSFPNWGGTDQRFWVEFIDHVLGFRQTAAGTYTDISNMAGYGSDFSWGTLASNSPPTAPQYMNYADNPARPLLRYWFSPILMVDFLHNYNMYENAPNYFFMQPGDTYEAPMYSGKQAFYGAINTMDSNHPNDYFALAFYSEPRTSASDTYGRFNGIASPLGPNYAYARSALFFPFSTINTDGSNNGTEVTPYDADPATSLVPSANFVDTPRAKGGTSFAMGLMLCYNQFACTLPSDNTLRGFVTSSPITFPTGMAGGLGRKGAQKVVIFETDGLANGNATTSGLVTSTDATYKYYPIRYDMNKPNSSEYPKSTQTTLNDPNVLTEVYTIVQQLASDYGSSRNPFKLYAIGFGPVFASGAPDASNALSTLQTMQYYGGTQSDKTTALPSSQIITGTDAQMSANLVSTFTSILQNGVQIALIK